MDRRSSAAFAILLLLFAVPACSGLSRGVGRATTGALRQEPVAGQASPTAPAQTAAAPASPAAQTVFAPTAEHDYRIPSLVATDAGVLVAFAEKRFGTQPHDHDTGYIQTVYRVRASLDAPWGPERVLCDRAPTAERPHGDTCGNPTAVYDARRRRIVVVLNANDGRMSVRSQGTDMIPVPRGGRRVLVTESEELVAGATDVRFGEPEDITQAVQPGSFSWDAVGPGAGIQLRDGRLVFPARGRNLVRDTEGRWSQQALTGTGMMANEGTVVELADGRLMRSDRATGPYVQVFRRLRSVTTDTTHQRWTTWSQEGQPLSPGHYCEPSICAEQADRCPAAFAEPRPQGCLAAPFHVHAAVGRIPGTPARLFAINPGQTRRRWGLRVHLSYDDGQTWAMSRQLVPTSEPSGYTAAAPIARDGEMGLAVLYEGSEGGRMALRFRWVSVDWVLCDRAEPTGDDPAPVGACATDR